MLLVSRGLPRCHNENCSGARFCKCARLHVDATGHKAEPHSAHFVRQNSLPAFISRIAESRVRLNLSVSAFEAKRVVLIVTQSLTCLSRLFRSSVMCSETASSHSESGNVCR